MAVGALTLEVGGATEIVDVKGEAPSIQATQRRALVHASTPTSVENLPIASRSFTALAALAPGVTGTSRIGDRASTGGGNTNVMMDGVSTMDTGSNRAIIEMNVESIAEVKVLVSSYQAEYGRSSGLQITAVTKSGTNRFRGSVYDVERNSDWNANSKTNKLNGDPKTVIKQRDWGYSIGGPVGKPGGAATSCSSSTAQEFEPRTGGNDVTRFRMPTALERQGDFSQTTDNNGNPYPYIKDPRFTGDVLGGESGRVLRGRRRARTDSGGSLYQTGLNILKMYPVPNIDGAGQRTTSAHAPDRTHPGLPAGDAPRLSARPTLRVSLK